MPKLYIPACASFYEGHGSISRLLQSQNNGCPSTLYMLQTMGQPGQESPGTESLAGILKGVVNTYSFGTFFHLYLFQTAMCELF